MYPQLSDIEPKIAQKIRKRATDLNSFPNTNDSSNPSNLQVWIRLVSGAVIKDGDEGLILESIPNKQSVFFETAGQMSKYGGSSFDKNSPRSGTIGKNLNNAIVDIADIASNADKKRNLRPSPVITALTIKEGKDQISRECTLNITCFTLAQLEKLQTYCMEPGYSLYIEYGWNTDSAYFQSIQNDSTVTDSDSTINAACKRGLNYEHLHKIRLESGGEFDCFLGFIVGGTVVTENENFNITINLRGAPSLPTFLQGHHKIQKKSPNAAIEQQIIEVAKTLTYDNATLTAETLTPVQRRFRYMFNSLPPQRQTLEVRNLESKVKYTDFVNFDPLISKKIVEYTDVTTLESVQEFLNWGQGNNIRLKPSAGVDISISKDKLFSHNRYIRFGLAVDILNANNKIMALLMGNEKAPFRININNSIIGAFPYIFSTNPQKLIITGGLPDFSTYFLNPSKVVQGYTSTSGGKTTMNAETLLVDSIQYPPTLNAAGPAGSDEAIIFVESNELNGNTPGNINTSGKTRYNEDAKYWGYLKNLYVNFDMFIEKMTQPNQLVGEVLLDILKSMSTAVNGFWNFQLVEDKDKDGSVIITIIDEHFIGKPTDKKREEFANNGITSPFLENNLDISIPADMANKIIMNRLSFLVNPEGSSLSGRPSSFFNSKTDLFLKKVQNVNTKEIEDTESKPAEEDEDKNAKLERTRAEFKEAVKQYNDFIAKYGAGNFREPEYRAVLDEARNAYKAAGGKTEGTDIFGISKGEGGADAELQAEIAAEYKSTFDTNMTKIEVVPKCSLFNIKSVEDSYVTNIDKFKEVFQVFVLKDQAYFDVLKQNAFAVRVKNNKNGTEQGLGVPMPIKYSFKTIGVSGLRRGDMFNIIGIPSKYKNNGLFQITEIEQTISDMKWETNVIGEYRAYV
jgi:hypothetical protein